MEVFLSLILVVGGIDMMGIAVKNHSTFGLVLGFVVTMSPVIAHVANRFANRGNDDDE